MAMMPLKPQKTTKPQQAVAAQKNYKAPMRPDAPRTAPGATIGPRVTTNAPIRPAMPRTAQGVTTGAPGVSSAAARMQKAIAAQKAKKTVRGR